MQTDENPTARLPTPDTDASVVRHEPKARKDTLQLPQISRTDSVDSGQAPPLLPSSSAHLWDEQVVELRDRWTQWPSIASHPVPLDSINPAALFLPAPTDEASTIGNDDDLPSPLFTAVNSSANSALHSPSVSSRADDDQPPRKKRRVHSQNEKDVLRFLDLSATEANADSDSDDEESPADRRFINDEDDAEDFEPDHSVVVANPRLFPDLPEGLPDDADELRAIGEALTAKYSHSLGARDQTQSSIVYARVDENDLKHARLAQEYERVPASTFVPDLGRVDRPRRGEKILASAPLVPVGDNSFFLVYTRKNHEYDLLLHLFHTSCVASATAVGLGSGLVVVEIVPGEFKWTREHQPALWAQSKLDWKKVVETTDDGPQVREMLKMSTYQYFCSQLSLFATQKLNKWERRGPKVVSGFEANMFIRSRCGTSDRIAARVSARWIRFRSGAHAGHLGLLQANRSPDPHEMYEMDEILIIPSLRRGQSEEQRLGLFNPERHDIGPVERRNQTFVWSERCFTAGGLEMVRLARVEPVPYDYDVVPHDAELGLFYRANVDGRLDLPFIGHTGALQPGDLVVLPADAPWGRSAGLIVAIHDVKTVRDEKGVVRLSKDVTGEGVVDRVRYACVVEPLDDLWSRSLPWKERLQAAQYYPLHDLRLHLLAVPRRIRAGDRITSVSSKHLLGTSATVDHVDGRDVVLNHVFAKDDVLAQQEQVQTRLPLRLVFVQLKIGDVVRVIRGVHINKVGFVVALLPAGCIELYPAELKEGKFVLVEAAQTNMVETRPAAPDPAVDYAATQLNLNVETTANRLVVESDEEPRDAPVILLRSSDVAFEQFDADDYRDYQVRRSDQALPSATLERQRAKIRRELRKDNIAWLDEVPIRVVGKHPLKGLFGNVKGYSWTVASPSKITNIFERYENLVVTVALDRVGSGNKREQIPYKFLAHRGSGLPLYTTSLVKSLANGIYFDRVQSASSSVASAGPPWVTKYGAPPDMHNILSMRFLMNDSRFVNKRLDVRVGTKEEFAQAINHVRQPRLAENSRNKDKFCGAMGYLKPLDKPLSEKEWHNFAKIFTAPGKTAYLPYPHVYPRRIAGEFKEDHIGTLNHVRVIVIGPSVGGGEEWMGQYGRVVLDNPTEWPTRVLWIEFPRKLRGDAVCPRALFYEESLCLALNTRIPGNPDTEVTSWD